jgi:hypothetical protein
VRTRKNIYHCHSAHCDSRMDKANSRLLGKMPVSNGMYAQLEAGCNTGN